jgi:hypothetical protein
MVKKVLVILISFFVFSNPGFAASSSTCYDTDTVLMLHMNGADASTTFTDSSTSAKTMTAVANAQIDTGQSKFGGASGQFDGTGDWITTGDSNDWDWGTGDLTVDFWVRFSTLTNGNFYSMISINCRTYGPRIEMDFGGTSSGTNTLNVYLNDAATVKTFSWTPSTATWYHVAVIRTGTTVRAFVNGTQVGVDKTESGNITGGTDGAGVAARSNCSGSFSASPLELNGWVDEVRVIKGTAVWTANFTAPSAEYTACAVRRRILYTTSN